MSMTRASGEMRAITALQMATESLAVPKSVMNTIAGFREAAETSSLDAGGLAHPAAAASAVASSAARRPLCQRDMGIAAPSRVQYMQRAAEKPACAQEAVGSGGISR